MPEPSIHSLPEQEALDQIVETIQQSDKGEAPFALVLGSGFSHGLVPTTQEFVSESLPLWIKCLKDGKPYESQPQLTADERSEIARAFWKTFVDKNTPAPRGLNLPLNSSGLPENNSDAYKAAFSPQYSGAVGTPAQARKFQRALMQLNRPRLNAAHFLLASLLGVQPGKTRTSQLFKAQAAFSRLILTTNFDPFLQTALQAVNRLYFMSDTPELGVTDDILDDQTDAIHLVYLHGSIHRRSQAATDEDIRVLKEKNARTLAPVLKRHGVIVLGYSGWDDAIVEALAAADRFDHRLYWCGLEADPLSKGAFGPRVTDILRKPAAVYVQTAGAGSFMAQLCSRLVEGLPRLLDNPIGQLKELLDIIDLKELAKFNSSPTNANAPQLLQSANVATAFVQAKQSTLERLQLAELVFLGKVSVSTPEQPAAESVPPAEKPVSEPAVTESVESKQKIEQLISSALLALSLGNYEECLRLCKEGLAFSSLEAPARAQLLMSRALANYFSGAIDEGLKDWTEIIELPGAPVEQVAKSLYNRAVTWGKKGDTEKAIADYTHVIEHLPDAPPDQVAIALNNRGFTFAFLGDATKSIDDYTRVIDHLPGAPVEQIAIALYNRGVTFGEMGDIQTAIADYTRLIEKLPDAPVEQVAQALFNRAVMWGKEGHHDKAVADYTQIIELSGAPIDQVAKALNNRGFSRGEMGDLEKAVEDYSHIVERLTDAPVEQVLIALNNRGLTWSTLGDNVKAMADYTRIIEQFRDGPVEQVAKAFYNRGVTWGEQGDTEKAIADYTAVIDQLPGAPVGEVAIALNNRGVNWGKQGNTDNAIADYTRVIEDLEGQPVAQIAIALNNRGLTLVDKGNLEQAVSDYTKVIDLPDAPIDQIASALNNRGAVLFTQGHADEASADYTRVIELPKSPVDQLAKALNGRGIIFTGRGETAKAIADHTRVIEELKDVPVEAMAQALGSRGWTRYLIADYQGFLEDTEAALRLNADLDFAVFNLGLALLAVNRDADAVTAYRAAAERYPEGVEKLALTDLRDATGKWLSKDRAQPVIQLLESLKK